MTGRRWTCLGLLACALVAAPAGAQEILIPNQMSKSLTFELHSVRDAVDVYTGDPQYLLQMHVRPLGAPKPKIDFSNTAQVAMLRVIDLTLLEPRDLPPDEPQDETGDVVQEEKQKRPADSQTWDLQLMPSAPTDFVLRCEGGRGVFDFTDMQVEAVHLLADTTEVRVDFKRPNPVRLQRFKLTATAGSLRMHRFLNARVRTATLQLVQGDCDIDLTGKPFEGESEIFFEGVPDDIRITVPRHVGLRLDGPASTLARFDAKDLERRDSGLVNATYDTNRCRLHLYFSQALPKLKVRWED